ncbi:glycosyltransferase family 2 protein [Phocaeicola acetigenes]|uniref:glycosyltransferase family 2 protein n=1 Tax=Phocaeicola acetigenes TaxID=3016083 RepID=UPI002FCE654D
MIVPIYNVEKYIEKCVRSLLEQTFKDIEYIFVNDATPDNSMYVLEDIISEYPSRMKNCIIINHSENKGVAAARNTGLNISKGEYVIYCDSDDWIEHTMLEDMYRVTQEQNAEIVTCDFRMAYNNHCVDYHTVDWSEDKIASLRNYMTYGWTVLWNILVKRDIYVQNKLKSLEADAAYCEDFNLSVKLLFHAGKIVHLDKILYNYNQMNGGSIMRSLNEKTMHDEQVMYLDVINYFKERGVYQDYEKQLGWRILKSKQEWVLSVKTYDKFLKLHPDSHKYIWSCPYINLKLKIMMWSLTHHFSLISRFMLFLRFLKHGK